MWNQTAFLSVYMSEVIMSVIHMVGDTGSAICEDCHGLVGITYKLRDVPFNDGSGIVKNILTGICDKCNQVISIPHQSTPAIKASRVERTGIESRMPSHLIDILYLASDKLGAPTSFSQTIFKYYLHALSNREISPDTLGKYLNERLAEGQADRRLSVKGRNVEDEINRLRDITHIRSKSSLMKSIVLKINDDLLVKKSPTPIKELRHLVAASV